jgi:hypothetical protein
MGMIFSLEQNEPRDLGRTNVLEVARIVREAADANKRTILMVSGPPAVGKSTVLKQLVEHLKRFHGINSVICDPDDRHDVRKGEVPLKKGRRSMQNTLVWAFDELKRPSRDMLVFPDAGDDLGMRYMILVAAMVLSHVWNWFVCTFKLSLREIHFNFIQLKVEAFWWDALIRNLFRDRQVDPILFFNAVRGVDSTFERMCELSHAFGIIENGLSAEQQVLFDWLFEKEPTCEFIHPIFGKCTRVLRKSPFLFLNRCNCRFNLTMGSGFADSKVKSYCADHSFRMRGKVVVKWPVEG